MVRTKEGGSVISFIVVAVILAGLLVGGAYAIRHMANQSAAPQAPQAPQQQTPASSPQPSSQSTSGSTSQTPSSTPSSGSQPSSSPSPTDQTAQQSPAASQLPQTGPEGVFGTIIALGALSSSITAYARSRRPELQF